MAVKSIPSSTADKEAFEFDNGDLEALKSVMAQFNFVDEQALFRFALYVLLQAENKTVYVKNEGREISLRPSSQLMTENDEKTVYEDIPDDAK